MYPRAGEHVEGNEERQHLGRDAERQHEHRDGGRLQHHVDRVEAVFRSPVDLGRRVVDRVEAPQRAAVEHAMRPVEQEVSDDDVDDHLPPERQHLQGPRAAREEVDDLRLRHHSRGQDRIDEDDGGAVEVGADDAVHERIGNVGAEPGVAPPDLAGARVLTLPQRQPREQHREPDHHRDLVDVDIEDLPEDDPHAFGRHVWQLANTEAGAYSNP